MQLGRAEGARGRAQRGPQGKPEEGKERREPILIASDLDLSYLSRVYPGLGSRLGRCSARTFVRGVRGPYVARHGVRWELVPILLEAAFYLASLVRSGSPGTSRIVPPLRLIVLSPFPRNEGGPRQEAGHQPVLTASGLDLSHLSRIYPGLGSRLWKCTARTFVRGVRGVRGAYIMRVVGFGGSSYQSPWRQHFTWLLWYELGFVPPSRVIGFGMGCVRGLRTRADLNLG